MVTLRITPACAGKRENVSDGLMSCGDHPRMRGEKIPPITMVVPVPGSPPHARGKEIQYNSLLFLERITPACAGKRGTEIMSLTSCWDHPRMRGEKPSFLNRRRNAWGSPPHARGKVGRIRRCFAGTGITPACAGKRGGADDFDGCGWDHPRMRGEKIYSDKL